MKDNSTITITFGDCGENHVGMQKVGKLADEGFNLGDLSEIKRKFEKKTECDIYDLGTLLPPNTKATPAYLLVIRNGVGVVLSETKYTFGQFVDEQAKVDPDTKALMYGKVMNKNARHNVCFDVNGQTADVAIGKGTVIAYSSVPILSALRDQFPTCFGKKASNLIGEGNYYYDVNKCGIGFHGDSERKKVIALRIGHSMNLQYQWFYKHEPIGSRGEVMFNSGDMYIMSEKAVGNDWKSSSFLTLRHAAGCKKFTTIDNRK